MCDEQNHVCKWVSNSVDSSSTCILCGNRETGVLAHGSGDLWDRTNSWFREKRRKETVIATHFPI